MAYPTKRCGACERCGYTKRLHDDPGFNGCPNAPVAAYAPNGFPIGAFSRRVEAGSFVSQPNPAPITGPEDLVAFLHFAQAQAAEQGFSVVGSAELFGTSIVPPRIDGACVLNLVPNIDD